MELKQIEKISKALGDVSRLTILLNMSKRKGIMQCSEIMAVLDLAQPSVSHHIKTLTEAGLIEPEKEGRSYSYQLNTTLLNDYIATMKEIAGN
jgi:ArsR family transcriptional regulator